MLVGSLHLTHPTRHSSARTHILGKSNILLGEPLFDKTELSNYRKFIAGDEDNVDLGQVLGVLGSHLD
jgi:hypothetical protein